MQLLSQLLHPWIPRPHCGDNCETDTGGHVLVLNIQTGTISAEGAWGYKREVGRRLQCRKFQETADMLRFLVFTSLAALGKNRLILLHLWHSAHTWILDVWLLGSLCLCFAQCWLSWRPSPGTWRMTVLRRELWEARWPDQTPGPGRYCMLCLTVQQLGEKCWGPELKEAGRLEAFVESQMAPIRNETESWNFTMHMDCDNPSLPVSGHTDDSYLSKSLLLEVYRCPWYVKVLSVLIQLPHMLSQSPLLVGANKPFNF